MLCCDLPCPQIQPDSIDKNVDPPYKLGLVGKPTRPSVCGCPRSLLNHATVVPVGIAIAGGK